MKMKLPWGLFFRYFTNVKSMSKIRATYISGIVIDTLMTGSAKLCKIFKTSFLQTKFLYTIIQKKHFMRLRLAKADGCQKNSEPYHHRYSSEKIFYVE